MGIATQGLQVSDWLLSASDEAVSSALALLQELSIGNLLQDNTVEVYEKVKNRVVAGTWASNSGDRFHERIAARATELGSVSRGERILNLFGELQQITKVAPTDFQTRFDVTEAAEDICNAAVGILRADNDSGFKGSDLTSMIEFQMTKIFGGMSIKLDELSTLQQDNLVNRIRDFIKSLPAEQQRFILQKLGASDLSDTVVRQALTTGALWTAFTGAVSVFGFAFYTTAAQLLAIVSFHLLPFGAYVALSSTIAVLANPFMIPISALLGLWYLSCKNRALKRTMAPLLVTSLCLSGMETQSKNFSLRDTTSSDALSLWTQARLVRDERRGVAARAQGTRDDAQALLNGTCSQLDKARVSKASCERDRTLNERKLDQSAVTDVSSIANGAWGPALASSGRELKQAQDRLAKARGRRDSRMGIVDTALGYVGYCRDWVTIQSEINSREQQLVSIVKTKWQECGSSYPEDAAQLLQTMERATSEIMDAEALVNRLEDQQRRQSRNLDDASCSLRQAQSAQAASEKRYFGMGSV